MVDLLRQVISQPMEDIRQVLQQDSASSSSSSSSVASSSASSSMMTMTMTMTTKKAEELIVSKLWMMEKALRGAAEILGDVLPLEESRPPAATAAVPKTTPPPLLSTGRDEILADLSRPEDRQYLVSIRLQVAQFLQFLQEEMQQQASSSLPSSSSSSEEGEGEEEGHHSSLASSLVNNLSVQKLWSQLLNLLLTRRMSCLKDVDNMRQVGGVDRYIDR